MGPSPSRVQRVGHLIERPDAHGTYQENLVHCEPISQQLRTDCQHRIHLQSIELKHLADCNFINSGLVSLIDPSHDNCTFHTSGGLAADEQSVVQETWCVAKPGTSDDLLQLNINFACNLVDCSAAARNGGACYSPATLVNHASFAMNLYYQITGRKKSNCNFRETGLIVSSDPSYGNCSYTTSTVQ
ncbi:Glucan endo-1,3-beta-glucosidase-beta-glucanase, putative isoform 2 [Hibiscus syriacus]|uniref:Glucan endo-1,3-beta-glucosidase-beta-glucanase, putative isoform 2 n=1 Tax=Hibiscus syriacus TaxID=106335 RepID=A0A6A2XP00_HIBSY|nr:Glucan endo-1,3-beta-glucosidase-beta-glucanase, putative isoform 2 [Hibiscus syriacus]